jgi:2-polyprenyl-3-methyl-5-hydroxy-6-metoxy-1,4-benzoquinol methylase
MSNRPVLDSQYAIERLTKPELKFRYKVRALFVSKIVRKYFKRTNQLRFLDFGAAEGLTLLEMHHLFPESSFDGIEYSLELIKRAPVLPENIRLIEGDVTSLPAEVNNKKYDIVCALALLEHLKNPLEAIKQAKAVLNTGGLFIASSPNPFWDHISTHLGLLRADQHETDMTRKIMINMILSADMEIVAYKKFMWSPVSFLPYLRIKVNPAVSLKIDNFISKLLIFNWLFVNQAIIARKK